MRSKYLPLLILVIICLSATLKKTNIKPDLKNMVLVKGGTFFMGIDSAQLNTLEQKYHVPFDALSTEYPAFRVTVQAFYMDKYEVTNADFKKFIDANPKWSKSNIPDSLNDGNYLKDWKGNKYPKFKANCPVVYVCWYAANAYARWLNKRLPTEPEFKFAAKGGHTELTPFPWGAADADTSKANYLQSNTGQPIPVRHYSPNSFGLYDMAGNVYQFCLDRWRMGLYARFGKFRKSSTAFPQLSPTENKEVVVRGGSWDSPAVYLRTTHREGRPITVCSADVGFRCAANIPKN